MEEKTILQKLIEVANANNLIGIAMAKSKSQSHHKPKRANQGAMMAKTTTSKKNMQHAYKMKKDEAQFEKVQERTKGADGQKDISKERISPAFEVEEVMRPQRPEFERLLKEGDKQRRECN